MEISEKSLDIWKRDIVAKTKCWQAGVCNGSTRYIDDPDKEVCAAHTACHSWVGAAYSKMCYGGKGYYGTDGWNVQYVDNAKPFVTLSCHRQGSATREASDFLIRWLARESPMSEFVLNKDDDESLINGGMILLCGPGGLSQSHSMWLCKVSRFTTEGNKSANVFMDLVKGGVDGMLAVYIASYIRGEANGGYVFTGLEGHSTVIGDHPNEIIGMYRRKLNFKAKSTSTAFENDFKNSSRRKNPVSNASDTIKGFCKPMVRDDGWGGQIKATSVKADDLVENVKAWEQDIRVFLREGEAPPPMPDGNTVYLELDL